ncbi:MAG: 7-cyano-7-deazaguanine synthase QueC [Nevskiaceae bacterium]|nr:MAG: 7-cyano-7-deazaguanine synthase QueC [Nevskiaceae bacterium]TBR74182.1 MAG: 7-cyano-7-deazaguanine synthase QueC [Nevskiaceae bacterium]
MERAAGTQRDAVLLLSGGLDSATVLALMRRDGYRVHALSVSYGQRHGVELASAARVAQSLGAASHLVMHVDMDAIGGSALTDSRIAVPEDAGDMPGIPVTYVPARNTIFLSLALSYAEKLGARDLFVGVNSVDYSGYPDCRPAFIAAFEKVANLGTCAVDDGTHFTVHAPLQALGKGDIIKAGSALGVDYSMTVSCYQADAKGRACGHCDACRLRRDGFREAGVPDPTRYV